MTLYGKIGDILKIVQTSSATHQKCQQQMIKLYEEHDCKEFAKAFTNCLMFVFNFNPKEVNSYVDKTLDFCALFCTAIPHRDANEQTVESELLLRVFDFLFKHLCCDASHVRNKCCQFIYLLLNNMLQREVSEELCDKLTEAVVERLQDRISNVRLSAIVALKFLQDPTNPNDAVTDGFVQRFADPNSKVRATVVEAIQLRSNTIPLLIGRTRDVDVNVRLASYKRFSKISLKKLNIVQRQEILRYVAVERAPRVSRMIIEKVVPFWLENYDDDVVSFLNALRLDHDKQSSKESVVLMEEACKLFFKTCTPDDALKALPIDGTNTIPVEKLTWETAVYWKMLLKLFRSGDDALDGLLDDASIEVVHFCAYVQFYCRSNEKPSVEVEYTHRQIILQQLFEIMSEYDLSDSASRTAVQNICLRTLRKENVSTETAYVIMKNVNRSFINSSRVVERMCSLVSEILEPIAGESVSSATDRQEEIRREKDQLNRIKQELVSSVRNEDYDRAEQLKHKIFAKEHVIEELSVKPPVDINLVEKIVDNATILKCCNIVEALMQTLPIQNDLSAPLQSLKENFVHNLLLHADPIVHSKALKFHLFLCMGNRVEAIRNFPLFCSPMFAYYNGKQCDVETALVSISAIVDLIALYGLSLNDVEEQSVSRTELHLSIFNGGIVLSEIIQILVKLMTQNDDKDIRENAGRGLILLILRNRVTSPFLLSQMILKWCNPCTDDNDQLKRAIGVMLECLPNTEEDCSENLIKAYVPTMKVIIEAPRTSPYFDVSVENVSRILVALCLSCKRNNGVTRDIANTLCNFMAEHPDSQCVNHFSKVLRKLDVPTDDKSLVKDLLKYCDVLCDCLNNKLAKRNIVQLRNKLNGLLDGDTSLKEEEQKVLPDDESSNEDDDDDDIEEEDEKDSA